MDSETPEERALDAKIFLIYQETDTKDVNQALQIEGLASRAENYTIRVSCNDIETNVDCSPVKAEIYCSSQVALETSVANVTVNENKLAAKSEEVRIVMTTLEILEAGTSNVLASKTITNLQ